MWRKLVREPLVHFLLLGGLLFLLYASLNRDAMRAPDEIVVDQTRLDALASQFQGTWQRPPTAAEMQKLVDAWVREEVLYREGMAARLDQGDPVVRRRVVQNMQFLNDGLATEAAPTEQELQAWLDAHPDDYREEPRYAFAQVFFDPQRHGKDLDAVVEKARGALATGGDEPLGDATLLPPDMPMVARSEIVRVFGAAFAKGLDALPNGEWTGPVTSAFGVHLVRIEAREPGRLPPLADVRKDVERDLARSRGDAAAEVRYADIRKRYEVRIDGDAARAIASAAAGPAAASDQAAAP